MLYNLICGCAFVLTVVLGKLLSAYRHGQTVIRVVSAIIFIYKIAHYIVLNIRGILSIPVEISCISYILLPLIITFKIKKLYPVGAFFGIMAGIGYFSFYTAAGFTVAENFTVVQIITGCFCHGYLYVAGRYLFGTVKLEEKDKLSVWVTLFAMLCWALVFYDWEMRGITFIYFIIKPEFLKIFSVPALNALLFAVYYAVIAFAFAAVLKLFFNINRKTHGGTPEKAGLATAQVFKNAATLTLRELKILHNK